MEAMSGIPASAGSPSPHATPDFTRRPKNWGYEQSVFWSRVGTNEQALLQVALVDLLDGSSALSKRVAGALPRFTLHDTTHLANVLYWMDRFVTPQGLAALGPVGCGLCLLLAYAHDLGMVPPPDWEEKLARADSPEGLSLARFTSERHPDLADMLERALPDESEPRARAERVRALIRDFIRTDYLRVTHAAEGEDSRVTERLRDLLADNALKKALAWICAEETALRLVTLLIASHNQSIAWLEERLRKEFKLERPWTWTANGAQPVNLLLPCLLLRLADICDFDASRTPRIVFHQLGLEGAASLGLAKLDSAAGVSRGEWQKHLAVDGWRWSGGDGGRLVYSASDCPHPAVEKAIRRFCGDIATECAEVDRVLRSIPGAREWVRLPREVTPNVTPRGYAFHDVEFKLQAHEVTELLMGTALYGNPELCIRELLQNALDAVQLRELRHKLKLKLDDAGIDASPEVEACEGWIKTERDQPKIELTWGRDAVSGREWIQVKDRGTGMTLDQITRYLSALGKSYYKSAEFDAEARLMRQHGLIATPI
jgi:molecular chaperone HtpG